MSAYRVWFVERSYGTDEDGTKCFVENNGVLTPLGHPLHEIGNRMAIQVFRDPIFPLLWTKPSEYNFEAWWDLKRKILRTEGSDLIIKNERRLSRHHMEAVHCVVKNNGELISCEICLDDKSVYEIHLVENDMVALDSSYNEDNLSLDVGWAEFLARDLAVWAGVVVREFRDDVVTTEYRPMHSILNSDHYLLNECKQAGEIKPNTFRITSDVNQKIEHYDALDFTTAKTYANDVASEDHMNVSFVFDAKFNAIYLGKHY